MSKRRKIGVLFILGMCLLSAVYLCITRGEVQWYYALIWIVMCAVWAYADLQPPREFTEKEMELLKDLERKIKIVDGLRGGIQTALTFVDSLKTPSKN